MLPSSRWELLFSLVAERGIMIRIEELTKFSNHFYILVDRKDYRNFLNYCIENNLAWRAGKKTVSEKDAFRCWDRMQIIDGKYLRSLKGHILSAMANDMDSFCFSDIKSNRINRYRGNTRLFLNNLIFRKITRFLTTGSKK